MRNSTCYMCSAPATTKEHIPARSFFGPEFRTDRVTVPSCDRHNLDNSLDVEYVRNVIAMHILNNQTGLHMATGKVIRSLERSIGLARLTLSGSETLIVDGKRCKMITCDVERLNRVMAGVAHGVYFQLRKSRAPHNWRVFAATPLSRSELDASPTDSWQTTRNLLMSQPYTNKGFPHPEVFQCGECMLADGAVIYRFIFYEGFVVFAWPDVDDG